MDTVTIFECLKCGMKWIPGTTKKPKTCPHCKSIWLKEKEEKKK